MIRDPKRAFDLIVEWTSDQIREAGARGGVVGLSGGADSTLVGYVLAAVERTGLSALGVIMPCHSSPWSWERAEEVARATGLRTLKVDLSAAYDSIEQQFSRQLSAYQPTVAETGALKSCLRAPTLDFAAKHIGGLIVGTGNLDEDGLVRYFQKRGDGAVDLSPIAGLHKSEVYQLLEHLGAPRSVIEAPPSADLWGPGVDHHDEQELGLSYAEVEWAYEMEVAHGAIRRNPTAFDATFGIRLGERERHALARVRRLERLTRHKDNPNLPAFTDIRLVAGLFEPYPALERA